MWKWKVLHRIISRVSHGGLQLRRDPGNGGIWLGRYCDGKCIGLLPLNDAACDERQSRSPRLTIKPTPEQRAVFSRIADKQIAHTRRVWMKHLKRAYELNRDMRAQGVYPALNPSRLPQ